MLPAIVTVQAEVDLHKRTPLRPLGFADQMQARLLRRVIGLLRITLDAGANNIFPRRRAAAIARNDVVQIQIFAFKNNAAVLARVFIALKNIVPGKLHFLLRHAVVHEQQDDARYPDAKRNGVDRFVVRRALGEITPLVKIEGAKRAVRSVDHYLGLTLKKQSQRAPRGADIDGLPQSVQHQNMLI